MLRVFIACFACLFTAGSALKLQSVTSDSQPARPEPLPTHQMVWSSPVGGPPSSTLPGATDAVVSDMCDESASYYDADACFEHTVGRAKADLQKDMNRDAALTRRRKRERMPNCTRRFYTYTFEQFEKEFPYMASCYVSTYAAVAHAIVLDDPCRTSSKSAADFLVPPPYSAHECNWPSYGHGHCKSKANSVRLGRRCKFHSQRAFVELYNKSGNASILVIDQSSDLPPYNLPALEYGRRGLVRAKGSSKLPYYRPDVDVSMPPPATARCRRVPEKSFEEPLESKQFFLSFKGTLNSTDGNKAHNKLPGFRLRRKVHKVLHNGRDRIIEDTSSQTTSFDLLLTSSRFLLIMGGDVEFSYRFNEAVCSGGVPVLITNTWIPPFREFVPFESYGVLVRENQVGDLLYILQSLTDAEVDKRRRMARKMCIDAFQTTEKTVSALLNFHTSAVSRQA